MKQKIYPNTQKPKKHSAHWAAKLSIKYGTILSILTLIAGFVPVRGSHLAISLCKTAVIMFAVFVIGGLLLDVIAVRSGKNE